MQCVGAFLAVQLLGMQMQDPPSGCQREDAVEQAERGQFTMFGMREMTEDGRFRHGVQ